MGNHAEEKERKKQRLSSEMLKLKADERKRKSGTGPGEETYKGITCGTAAGAKQGRTKGNQQKAEYGNRERKHGKPGWEERGKPGSESGRAAPGKPLRGRSGKNGKEETEGSVARREAEADERKRKRNGKCRKRRGRKEPEKKASTRGTAVGAKRGRAKGNIQDR